MKFCRLSQDVWTGAVLDTVTGDWENPAGDIMNYLLWASGQPYSGRTTIVMNNNLMKTSYSTASYRNPQVCHTRSISEFYIGISLLF